MVRLSLMLLVFAGARLFAATYYVSNTGSDSNPGSQSQPWSTVQKAANTMVAGDTVNIAAGTYGEHVTISTSGTSGSRITYNGPGTVNTFSVSGSYVTLSNLTVNSTTGTPMVNLAGNYDILTTCTFSTAYSGTRAQHGVDLNGSYCMVTNCDWPTLAVDGVGIATASGQTGAMIVNNRMHDIQDPDAFVFVWGTSVVIRGNVMTNCQNDGYYSQQVHADFMQCFGYDATAVLTNVVVENNLIINCNCQCWMLDCGGVTQGLIANNMGGMTIRNNLFINSGQSGFIDLPYASVYNNLFYNWGWGNAFAFCVAPAHGQWGGGDHARVKNNVFYSNGTTSGSYDFTTYGSPVDLQADYNYTPSSKGEAHGIVGGTPGFVNVGVDFHLLTNSILRNAGINLTSFFTTDKDGCTRPASGAWDIGAFVYGSLSTNPVIWLSPTSLTFGSISTNTTSALTFTVQNTGGGTLAGTATVSAPFSIVSGGSYSLGANQSQTVTVRFSPKVVGSVTNTVTFTGAGGKVASVSGTGVILPSGSSTTFLATSGTITAPFVVTSGLAGTSYISQSVATGVTNGGKAVYTFTITNAGSYVVQVLVNAGGSAANSCYVNIDAQPQDPGMIWDIPVTTGFEQRLVSWRGNGTSDNAQFVPQIFNLTVGTHQLIVVGREANVQLQSFTISPTLPTPQNLRVISP